MSRELLQQALDALQTNNAWLDYAAPQYVWDRNNQAIAALEQELANYEEPLPPVDIGVDVTPEGTHVVACYNRPDAVQEMFYSQFHPLAKPVQAKYSDIVSDGGLDPRNKLAKPEQAPKLSDAGADTNISRGLEPKGSGMVTLNQPEQEPCKCIDQFWCATFDRCKRNE